MEHLEYQIQISAPAKAVWKTMLEKETYNQWVAKSWPDSTYHGKWAQGEEISFTSGSGGGTMAKLEIVKPYERILARHLAIINIDGSLDRSSEMAKTWVGITEEYRFMEKNGNTTLTVLIETAPEWRKMFDDGWPTALQELKAIAEKQLTHA